MKVLLVLCLLSLATLCPAATHEASDDDDPATCPGSDFTGYFKFWTKASASPSAVIPHVAVPAVLSTGYTMQAGFLGENQFAQIAFQDHVDAIATPFKQGLVSTSTGLPTSKTGGWEVADRAFSTSFANGLQPSEFTVLLQKKGLAENVAVVRDTVFGITKNVIKLTAQSNGVDVGSTGLLQSANLYTSGRYEITAKFPQVHGLVSSFWAYHYEEHKEKSDPQYNSKLAFGGVTQTNHEIDMEIPASCPGMCSGGGCPGQFDTMNLNAYRYTNSDGEGPAYANLCVRAPFGTEFVDNEYHVYAMEWHTGDEGDCEPHINFYFDGTYIGSVNVFIPTRGVRLILGIWGGDSHWVGVPDWSEAYAYISSATFTPFDEVRSTNFPMIMDQPTNHPHYVAVTLPPPHTDAEAELAGEPIKQPSFKPRLPVAGGVGSPVREAEGMPAFSPLAMLGAVGAVAVLVLSIAGYVVYRRSRGRSEAQQPLLGV